MYLSRLHLQNWRSYADAVFEFKEPTQRKSVVLVGAMNGHGKTSFLVSLYLGLFGKFGLRYCEGFRREETNSGESYRSALGKYRRNHADPSEPTIIDLTLTPTHLDTNEDDVRIVRRWFFNNKNEPKQGEAFEQVDVYVGGRLLRTADSGKDPLALADERVERSLFPAHVAPAFFFDGEQAQELIEKMGEPGIKKAAEVMFGTKVVAEAAQTISEYLIRARQAAGGKRKASERQLDLEAKIAERDRLNEQIAKAQADHLKLEHEKDERESERNQLQEEFVRLGGGNLDAAKLQADVDHAQKSVEAAEKSLTATVSSLGLSLSVTGLVPKILNRLKQEETLESWEGLKKGTLDNKEKVLAAALPEPPESDPLLGNIAPDIRKKVRERIATALERIYNPPPPNCAESYLLGHVKGERRAKVRVRLDEVQCGVSAKVRNSAKQLRSAREAVEELRARLNRSENVPEKTKEVREKLDKLNTQNQEISRKLGSIENELRKLKADLHTLNVEIGNIQDDLAKLGPEQRRIAVAERVNRALEDLQEKLKPTTTNRLEDVVTRHFVAIADKRFRGGRIHLPNGGTPEIELADGTRALLEMFSGFEKRSFAIAFSLALAEITRRRIPLVIDTPLGNADSAYRPRTLRSLTDFDLDQTIILTHDKEVTHDLVDGIKGSILQTFLVEYHGSEIGSVVVPDKYFES